MPRRRERKLWPSGRKQGQRTLSSRRDSSSFVTPLGVPPAADICCSAPALSGAKTITPSRFQAPPRAKGASQSVSAGPPAASIFLSFPSAKNPTKRLSGDQNGNEAPSVPVSACAESPSRERTQRISLPSAVGATKVRRWPSGEMLREPALVSMKLKLDFSGARIEERTARTSTGDS